MIECTGPVLRTEPNFISICTPNAVRSEYR